MTTSINESKTLLEPKLYDMLASLKQDIFRSMNCVKIGQIQTFDPSKKTAQVQILFKRVVPNADTADGSQIIDYPVLVDCPVFTLQGGGAALQMPIAAGDQCILLFADRNIDAWFKSGQAAAPFNARCHDMSDGIAIVGLNSLVSNLATYPADTLRLSYAGAKLELSGGLVGISNATTSLLMLLQQLAMILEAATIDLTHGVFTGATITAITNWALSLSELLQ
jgi:hypothetical protein